MIISSYIIFNKSTGEISRSVVSTLDLVQYELSEYEDYIEHIRVDDTLYYVVNKNITPRPTFSERILGTTVDNLPIPTTVTTNGNSYTITDGSAELSFSLPGTYKVYLSSFPYQDKVVEVTQV